MQIACEYIELSDPRTLVQYSKNRNKHTKDQIDRLCKLIEHHGFRNPIIVSKLSNQVVAGNGRLQAALQMGLEMVPVSYQDFENEEAEYTYSVSDNAIALWAELDLSGINTDIIDLGPELDIELLGIKNFEIDICDKDPGCDEDEVPEVKEPISKPGDLYILGRHRILCGDSTDILQVEKLMDGQKADMVFTDPPYGIGLKYQTHDDSEEKWFDLIKEMMCVIYAIKPVFTFIPCCRIKALKWWYENYSPDWIVCWYKGSPGHMSQIGFNDWEPHLTWGKPKKQMHDYFQTKCGFEIDGHPCPKPIEYCEWVIERAVNDNDIVTDLFGGSGSTLIACEKTNRNCYMMEIDPHYIDVIVSRYCKYTKTNKVIRNGEEIEWGVE